MMVKVLGETPSIQGMKEKVLGTFHKTILLLECTFGLLGHPQEYKLYSSEYKFIKSSENPMPTR
jgi:hypothetical protein